MTVSYTATGWIADDATFGARLALIRQRMQWTNVKAAALACGVTVQSWRDWERGTSKPRDYMAACEQIAGNTGCDVYWLAGLPRLDSNQEPAVYRSAQVSAAPAPRRRLVTAA